jgi:predicted ABC-type ATPase
MKKQKKEQGPAAVWACGPAASGKSRICEPAVLPLGFELADADNQYEELLKKYNLGPGIPDIGKAEQEEFQAEFSARRAAERLLYSADSDGQIAPQTFLETLRKKVEEGKFNPGYLQQLSRKILDKVGPAPIPGETFLKTVLPEMGDWQDPLDYLRGQESVTPTKLLMVAKEITRRRILAGGSKGQNLLVVETGGLWGSLIDTKEALEENGYRTFLLWMQLDSVEAALRRNEMRRAAGGRGLSERIIRRSFQMTALAREILLEEFAPHTAEIDNTSEGEEHIQARIEEVRTRVQQWLKPETS